jgi:hypothetical protein
MSVHHKSSILTSAQRLLPETLNYVERPQRTRQILVKKRMIVANPASAAG